MTVGMSTSTSGYSSSGSPTASSGAVTSTKDGDDKGFSVAELRKKYTEFLDAKREEIEEQRTARHYVHGDQLTSTQLAELVRRGQPATIRDKLSRKVNGIVGLLERMRQDPKGFGRTPGHDEDAEIATGVVRYVCDANNWQALSAEEARDGSINGIYGLELDLIQGDQGDPDIGLNETDNDTFFYDPTSYRYDFSDASYMGVAKWVGVEIAKEMIPGKDEEIDRLVTHGTSEGGMGIQQRDREIKWTDSSKKRIFLVEIWCLHKKEWTGYWYCGDTILQTAPSPFQDEKGKSICRYIMASVNVDHDGDRYGYVRQLKTLIDELNALVSKRAHLINTRRIIMEQGAVSDVDALRKEAVRADGVIVRNPGKELLFDDARAMADIAAINESITEVKTEIENFGPNIAVLGQALENSSGRAIALLQQAGTAELGPFIISYRDWKLRVYRAIWNACRQHWKAERWIRVTDDEQSVRFMGLNVMQLDQMGQPGLVSIGPDGQPMARGGIGELDVDIILDEGPDTLTMMQDTSETLKDLTANGVQLPPKILIMASNLPASEKKKIIDEMEQAAQASAPFDEAIKQGKAEELALDNAKTEAETQKIRSETGVAAMEAAMGGQAGAPGMSGQPVPVDPIAMAEAQIKAQDSQIKARDSESKAELTKAQAMAARAAAIKSAAETNKIIQETYLLKKDKALEAGRSQMEARHAEEDHSVNLDKTKMETKVLGRPEPKPAKAKAKS